MISTKDQRNHGYKTMISKMYSTQNEGKPIVTERFRKTLI